MQKYKSSFSLPLRDEHDPQGRSLSVSPLAYIHDDGGSRCVLGIYTGWAPHQALYRGPVTHSSQRHYVLRTLGL